MSRVDVSGTEDTTCMGDGTELSSDELESRDGGGGGPSTVSQAPYSPNQSPSGGNYTANNLRSNLKKLSGETGEGCHAHHVFPKTFANLFKLIDINVHDPRFGAFVEAHSHLSFSFAYNQAWAAFFASGSVSREAALSLGRELARTYCYDIHY